MAGSIGIMQNRDAQRVCSAAGMALTKGKLASLYEVRKSLLGSIEEAKKAESDAKFWDRALLTAQILKGACDGIIGVLGEVTGPLGKTIKEGYKTTSGVATDVSRHVAGQNVNFVATASNAAFGAISTKSSFAKLKSNSIGASAEKMIGGRREIGSATSNRMNDRSVALAEKQFWKGGVDSKKLDAAKAGADSWKQVDRSAKALKVPTDAVIEAVDADTKNRPLKKEVFVKIAADIGSMAADAAVELNNANFKIGADKYVKLSGAYSAAKDVAFAGVAIMGAIEDYKKNGAGASVASARKTLEGTLGQLDKKIANLEKLLSDCAPVPQILG